MSNLREQFHYAVELEDQARNLCFKMLNLRTESQFSCNRLNAIAAKLERRMYRRRDKRETAYIALQNYYFDREKAALDHFNHNRISA